MTKIRMQLLATAAMVALTSAAYAADMGMPLKAPPPPPAPVASWSGCHIGVNAGAGWSNQSAFTSLPANGPTGAANTLVTIPFLGSLDWGTGLNASNDPTFVGGGQVGCDYQAGAWVFGLETDFQGSGATGASNTSFTPDGATGVVVSNQFSSKTPWFGTVRARLGITFNPGLLAYVTGGFAYGREEVSDLMQVTSGGALVEQFPFSTSSPHVGYTVGGGLEYMFANNWQIRFEYLYVSLQANGNQVLDTTFLGAAALPTDAMQLNAGRDNFSAVRVGLDYKFN